MSEKWCRVRARVPRGGTGVNEPNWLSTIFREIQNPRPALAVFVTCGVCLLVGGPVGAWIRGTGTGPTWVDLFRPWLILAFLVSAALLVWDLAYVGLDGGGEDLRAGRHCKG